MNRVFRHCCVARNQKMEKTNLKYACLAKVVRQGGFKVVLIMRYSAIPSHCLCPMLHVRFAC